MRLISPGPTPPAEVNKYLLPHERQVITVRQHPAVFMPSAVGFIGGLLVAVVMTGLVHISGLPLILVWTLTALLLLELISVVALWSVRYLVVTPNRLLLISGLRKRRVISVPLSSVQHHFNFDRSFSGRIYGYGSFTLQLPDQGRSVIDYMPYPEQLYLEICAMVFPGR